MFSTRDNRKKLLQVLSPAYIRKGISYILRGQFGALAAIIRSKAVYYRKKVFGDKDERPLPLSSATNIILPAIPKIKPLKKTIDIIIPIYNGYAFLSALFQSIYTHTHSPFRLILIDDASSDKRVRALLRTTAKKRRNILLIRNDRNYGFVESVNRGVQEATDDFVILNTDTEVPKGWLSRLMTPFQENMKIASVTPMTNSGRLCSFPVMLRDNALLNGQTTGFIDTQFSRINVKKTISVPTGVGFCMAFRKKVVDEIGMFDADAYPRGYGEENDWCMRAMKRGYTHCIAANLFVYHKHTGSFKSKEKAQLVDMNARKLRQRYPRYPVLIQQFVNADPLRLVRDSAAMLIAQNTRQKKVMLIIDHNLGGGAGQYAHQLITEQRKKNIVYHLQYNTYAQKRTPYRFTFYDERYTAHFHISDTQEIVSFFTRTGFRLDTVIINSLVSYTDPLAVLGHIRALQKKTHARIILPLHDYFPISPVFTLLDDTGKYSGVPKKGVYAYCGQHTRVITSNADSYTGARFNTIAYWQKEWGKFLKQCNQIICFSKASKDILRTAYPKLSPRVMTVRPHRVDYIKPISLTSHKTATLHIGVVGVIRHEKGRAIIKEMLSDIRNNKRDMKIIIFGSVHPPMTDRHLKVTGRYTHATLPAMITQEAIDIFFLPSICPETFSYVAEEIMHMAQPLAVFNIGAPPERVRRYKKGYIINAVSADAAVLFFEEYRKKRVLARRRK